MSCKYCDRKPVYDPHGNYRDFENEEIIRCGDWSSLGMGVDEKGKIFIVAHGDGPTYYYPKFCPECGEKMKDILHTPEKQERGQQNE